MWTSLSTTNDILNQLKTVEGFKVVEGKLSYKTVTIDLLTMIDDQYTMAQIEESVETFGGISFLRPDFALAVKVKCAYLRSSDPVLRPNSGCLPLSLKASSGLCTPRSSQKASTSQLFTFGNAEAKYRFPRHLFLNLWNLSEESPS
jgi:hypothetical protein